MAEHIKNFARLSFDSILRLFPSRRFRIFALIILATLVTSGVLVLAHPSFAADVITSDIGASIVRALVWLMLQLATIFIQLTVFLLRFFILIAGYNNYINAPVVLLGWNMVRDVANMFFIVILMVIAFGTILGLEQYEWRKSLVKLVLAAILVNFSNLIVQLLIDVAQVFTITFLNAVAGAAGGNLIQMFNFDKIFDIAVGSPEEMTGELLFNLFGAGVISLVFAGMAMFTMGAYVVVLLARVVVLWMAIILSPLMFMFSVLPQTKKYADEYWSEVSNHILAAPVMVFFMWLAFATFGGGSGAVAHLEDGHGLKEQGKITTKETNLGTKPSVGIGKAASWENMANFAVALAFLWLGIDRVQKLGVKGGGLTQSAMNFGKNVATIASGYAAGRWLAGKGADLGMSAAKGLGMKALETTQIPHGLRIAGEKIKQKYYGSALGRGSLRREGSLANYKKTTDLVKETQKSIGDLNSKAGTKLAKATMAAEVAKRSADADYGVTEHQMRVSEVLGQKKEYDKRFQSSMEEAIKRNKGQQLSPQEEAVIRSKVAADMKAEGKELPALALLEAKFGAKKAKAATESDIMGRFAKDTDRMIENKLGKNIREYEDGEFNADIKSFAVMDYDTRVQETQRQMAVVRKIREDYGANLENLEAAPISNDDKTKVRDAYKNGMRNIELLLTSAFEQGEGNDVMQAAVLPALKQGLKLNDAQLENWNDRENLGKFVQMAISQGSVLSNDPKTEAKRRAAAEIRIRQKYGLNATDALNEGQLKELETEKFFDVDAARKEEETARKVVGDKWNLTTRGLMRAMNGHATKSSNPTAFNQVRAGVNSAGVETLGFAQNMEAGQVKSSRSGVLATGRDVDGVAIRRGKQEYLAGEIQRITQIHDGRSIIHVDGKGVANKVADDAARKMLKSIGRMASNEIRGSIHRSVFNMLSGGQFDRSSYTEENGVKAFRPISNEMKDMFTEIIGDMKAGIAEAAASGNQQTYDRRLEALQELMFQMTGKRQTREEIQTIYIGDQQIGSISELTRNSGNQGAPPTPPESNP